MSSFDTQKQEVARGDRFEFGQNWQSFLGLLTPSRLREAERSLREMLEREHLRGRTFLDVGSGSGLFSLAARNLGARVTSFDYDPASVACTHELRRRFYADDSDWKIVRGSVLDVDFIRGLGSFDIVYSWGVLHHTGDMWRALDNVRIPVGSSGQLYVAIYNDMGSQSTRWRWLKKTYNRLPRAVRPAYAVAVIAPTELKELFRALRSGGFASYLRAWTQSPTRGMNRWHDIIDWVGGYPYEYAKPDTIFSFYKARGFELQNLHCRGGLGCNEFVFSLNSSSEAR